MKELYSENLEMVRGAMDEFRQDDSKLKSALSVVWQRNVNFANGNQVFTSGVGNATPDPQVSPYWFQNNSRQQIYVTNEIEPITRTLVSYMTRQKPSVTVYAAGNDYNDKSKAKVGEKVHEAKYALDAEYNNSKMSAFWALTCGTCVRKDFWDYSFGEQFDIPVYDEFGNEVIDPQTGDVMTQKEKAGGNRCAILPPFSICVDNSITDWRDQSRIIEAYLLPVETAREMFDLNLPGYTGQGAKIGEHSNAADGLAALEALKYSVPYLLNQSQPNNKGKCLVQELHLKPNAKFPKGRLVIIAGTRIVYASPAELGTPYYMPYEPINWHPYSFYSYEPYIGRFWGKSMVEQLVPLQMRINEINGAILNNANTIAKPNILAVENQLKRGVMTGEGSSIYTYRLIPGAAPPSIFNGAPLPAQFFQERQSLIDEMVRIVGTNFVMQGQAPTGVTAASAIAQLLENASTQHSDMMHSWEEYHETGFTKKLRLIRKFQNMPNYQVVDYIRLLANDALDIEIESFVGEDLSDGIGVKVESGSMIPKSEQARTQLYNELADKGLLGPAQEPSPRGEKIRTQLFQKMGLEPFDTEESIEIKKAKWENEMIIKNLPVEVSKYDNAAIHMPCHIEKVQDPAFLERATPEQKKNLLAHIAEHEQVEKQKAQEAQMQQIQATGGVPPPPNNLPPQVQNMPPEMMGAPEVVPAAPILQ